MVCRQEDPLLLLNMMEIADPLPIGPGEWQGNVAAEYKTARLRASKPKEQSVGPSESTASDSSSSIQQGFKQPLDNTGYKADPRPVSEQRSE